MKKTKLNNRFKLDTRLDILEIKQKKRLCEQRKRKQTLEWFDPWSTSRCPCCYLDPDPWLNLNCFWFVVGDPTILAYWTCVVIALSKLHCYLRLDLGLVATINATIDHGFVERILWKRTVLFIPTHLDLILLFFSF